MMLKMINLYVKECLRELMNYSKIIMLVSSLTKDVNFPGTYELFQDNHAIVLSLTRDVNFPGTYELFPDNHASRKFNLANLQ